LPRAKSSVPRKEYVKRILKNAKGYYGRKRKVFRIAHQSFIRAGMFAFAHRRKKKGDFRGLWNIRISAVLKEAGISYSKFIHALKQSRIELNKKSLAELAVRDLDGFKAVLETVKTKIK